MQEEYELAAEMDIPYIQVEIIAQVAHAAVRAFTRIEGDYSLDNWEDQSASYRRRVRRQVLDLLKDPRPIDPRRKDAMFQAIVGALDPRKASAHGIDSPHLTVPRTSSPDS